MGYTHYFTQNQDIPLDQWATLKDQLSAVLRQLPEYSDSAGGGYSDRLLVICDGEGTTLITAPEQLFTGYEDDAGRDLICFNGDERNGHDLGHETFYLTREGRGFSFCKTARKPYDWLVVAALLLVEKHCPGCYEIDSDGNAKEWAPVMAWLNEHGFGPVTRPAKIRATE